MKLQTIISYVLALAATFLLAACGGGGASVNPNQQGITLVLSPVEATFYAGVPATMTIQGGRAPFALTSSEANVLPVPPIVNSNTFDVLGTNPSVVDTGLPPNALPVRTVNLTVHDANGNTATAKIHVAQNFLTGYGITFGNTTCTPPVGAVGGAALTPCAGGDTAISFTATSNGILHGNQQFRLDVVRGQFALFDPLGSTTTVTQHLLVTSNHDGTVNAIIRVPAGVPSQIADIQITEVGSGVSTDTIFSILGTSSTLTLTAIPGSVSFTGALSTQCGTGSSDVFIFDGAPPYSALSTSLNVTVTPVTPGGQPGRFTIVANNPNVCLSGTPVIFLDSLGNRTTVTVTTILGSTVVPAPPALTVAPLAIALVCGSTGSVSAIGGTGAYSVSSSSPVVTATVSGKTISITRTTGDVGGPFPTTSQVSVTDGSTVAVVVVTVPANCP